MERTAQDDARGSLSVDTISCCMRALWCAGSNIGRPAEDGRVRVVGGDGRVDASQLRSE